MKKLIITMLVSCMVVGLTACGSGSGAGNSTPAPAQTEATSEAKQNDTEASDDTSSEEPAHLKVLFCQGPTEAGLEDVIDEALADQAPNITCEYEVITWEDLPGKLQQYMQSGMPDIVIAKSQDANNYAQYGIWADLSDKDYIKNVYSSALWGVTRDDQILGMPYIGSYGGVYYNKKIFSDLGLEVPKTYDDLEKVCAELKKNNITPFATHFLDSWFHLWEMAIASGGELMSSSQEWGYDFHDGKRDAADDDFQMALYAMDLIHENTFDDCYSVEQSSCDARFIQGEAAMQFDMSGVAATYMELAPDLDFGIFPFPTSKGDGCLNMEPNATFFKSASTEYDAACDKFLSIMADPEMAGTWSQYVKEASLITGADSFETPAQSDIDYYSEQGLTRDQNIITNQLPALSFWDPLQNDFTEYINGSITRDELTERANGLRDVCGAN